MTHLLLNILGLESHCVYCLLFGAVISPTEPIALLAILKVTKVEK